jgi:hypothetical protein
VIDNRITEAHSGEPLTQSVQAADLAHELTAITAGPLMSNEMN